MEPINRQLFFSHTWQHDKLNRNTHKRVYELAKKLENCGWSIWIDEDNIIGNIDAAMASGIDNAEAIIVCLTESYCLKVNETAKDPRRRDNCLKEWTYANARNKLMIPVVMEPCLSSINDWPPGVVSLYFGSTLYVNATNDNLNSAVISINKLLEQYKLNPQNKKFYENTKIKKSEIIETIKKLDYSIALDKTKKKKNLSNKYLLFNLLFNKRLFDNLRRQSEPIVLSNNKLFRSRQRYKSTGQIKSISI